jgi:hypothetical protein
MLTASARLIWSDLHEKPFLFLPMVITVIFPKPRTLRLRLSSAVDLTLCCDVSDDLASLLGLLCTKIEMNHIHILVLEDIIKIDDCFGRWQDSYRSIIMHMAGRHHGTRSTTGKPGT